MAEGAGEDEGKEAVAAEPADRPTGEGREEAVDAGPEPELPLAGGSQPDAGSPGASDDEDAMDAEASGDEAKGLKRKRPESEEKVVEGAEEGAPEMDAEGEKEGEDESLTAKEKRSRGIPTLASPERTSEHPTEDVEAQSAQSPADDPKEKMSEKGSVAEAGASKEEKSPMKDLFGEEMKDFWEQEMDAKEKKPGVPESDDDWGMDLEGKDAPQESLMEEIRKQRDEVKEGWEREKWEPAPSSPKGDGDASVKGGADEGQDGGKEAERELNDEDDWKGLFPQKEDDAEEEEDENYWYNDVEPDGNWRLWPQNSKEALASTVLVQKIRARAGKAKTPGGPFPSEEASQVFLRLMTQRKTEQKMLIAALMWIEANVLEVKVVPPDLSEAIMMLLETEADTLRSVSERIPDTVMRTNAGFMIPLREVRKNSETTVEDLVGSLHGLLPGVFADKEELATLVEEELGHVPCTLRIAALIHACEFARLKGRKLYASADDLAVAFAKQRLPERAIEVVCRLTLERSMDLAKTSLEPEAEELRSEKIKVLERLRKEWRLRPSEEQLSQIHTYTLPTQLHILLHVERDIERFWVKIAKVKSEADRAKELANFLDFTRLVKPYLLEEAEEASPLMMESGCPLSTRQLAQVRWAVSEVLGMLHARYRWVPDLATRRVVSKTNWVARLSSLLTLAGMPDCLHADAELRNLLSKEAHRKQGLEVLQRFQQWAKLEEGEGVVIKAAKMLDEQQAEESRRLYKEYVPDPNRKMTAAGYMPMTPGALGSVQAMPSTPGFFGAMPGTPGIRAAMTPAGPPPAGARGRAPPGTPAGPPPGSMPMTPSGAVPGTPAGPPPGTPGLYRAPGTPAGPPPPTPGGLRPPGTPAGPPPPTPGGWGTRPPGTPAGPPPMTPGGFAAPVPMTPMGVGRTAGTAVPTTPGGAFAASAPMTPAGALPGTPRERVPSTPKDTVSGGTSARLIPATPAEALSPGSIIPRTPMGAGGQGRIPSTPAEALSPASMVPRTPTASGRIPATPAAAFAEAARIVPQTPARPGAAAPFTPAPVPMTPVNTVPMTPAPGMGAAAPFTPRPGGPAPFTPAGPAPFTPAGPAPMTPGAAY